MGHVVVGVERKQCFVRRDREKERKSEDGMHDAYMSCWPSKVSKKTDDFMPILHLYSTDACLLVTWDTPQSQGVFSRTGFVDRFLRPIPR